MILEGLFKDFCYKLVYRFPLCQGIQRYTLMEVWTDASTGSSPGKCAVKIIMA